MKKQTAVEWLALYIKGITSLNCDEVIEQAKEMEKAEKIRTQIDCWEKALKIIPREDEDRILLRVEDLKQQLKKLEDESN
jgi:hypothetical protein